MKQKTIPTQEIINRYTFYTSKMLEAVKSNDFNTANDFVEKMEELNAEYDFFDREFTENGQTGLKDINGKVRIPAMYKEIGARYRYDHWRSLPVPVVNEEGKYAIVLADGTGNPLCDFEYDYICCLCLTNLFVAQIGDKATILRPDGTKLIPFMVDSVYGPSNGIIVFENEGKFGLCTQKGDYVEPIYDEMETDENEDIHVRLGESWGYISYEGKFLPEPLDDEEYAMGRYTCNPDWN
ncbi:MAG: hypothetical protein IJZ68_00790 [Bacteroidaceae bacterium]|nr:hypothetical protein [Bacteroidaceae bacterium]